MDTFDLPQLLAIASVLGFASGIRLYAVVFAVGLAGHFDWLQLPGGLAVLQHPVVLMVAGAMMVVEFTADKVPGVDTVWDMIQTFIRIPAGAALAAAALGGLDSTTWSVIAALLGGSLAATSHMTKAGTRAAVNTSPEPFSNVAVSLAEDVSVIGLLLLALAYPLAALAVVVILLALAAWLLPKLFRFVIRTGRALFGRNGPTAGAR